MVAIDFVLKYPKMVSGLIPVDSALSGYDLIEFGSSFESIVNIAFSSGIDEAKAAFGSLDLFKPAASKPKVAQTLWKILKNYSGWHFTNENPATWADPPAIIRLESINTPTLVIIGEDDSQELQEISDILSANIPNAVKATISGAGHVSNLESSDEFNRIVLSFLAIN